MLRYFLFWYKVKLSLYRTEKMRYSSTHSLTPPPRYPGIKDVGTHRIAGRVGPRDGLDDFENRRISCPYWNSNPEESSP